MLPSRIAKLKIVPFDIRKILYHAEPPSNPYEELYQHIIGRAVMDALGFTGLDKPYQHNTAVRSARVWLKFGENVEEWFDMAKVEQWEKVRKIVLDTTPFLRKDD